MALILPGAATKSVFTTPASISFSGATTEWRYGHFRFDGAVPVAVLATEGLFSASASGSTVGAAQISYSSAGLNVSLRGATGTLTKTVVTPLPAAGTNIRWLIKHSYATGAWAVFYNGAMVLSGTTDIGATPLSPSISRSLTLAGSSYPGANLAIEQVGIGLGALPSDAEAIAFTSGLMAVTDFAVPPAWQFKPIGTGIVSSFSAGGLTFTQTSGATSGADAPTLGGAVTTVTLALTEIVDNHAAGGLTMAVGGTSAVAFAARSATTGRINITVRGTYSGGTPTGVALAFGTNAFASASSATISGGTFEATFDIAQTGFGLRIANAADLDHYQTYANIRAGDRWVICGQSNAQGAVNNANPADPLPAAFRYGQGIVRTDKTTGALAIATAPGQDMAFTWALAMVQYATGVPVCVANVAIGATSITSWLSGGSSWTTADPWMIATAMKGHANRPRLLWNQGENDTGMTQAQYDAAFSTFLADAQGSWGLGNVWVTPIYSAPSSTPMAAMRAVARRRSDVRVVGGSEWIKLAPDAVHTDTLHLQSPIDAAMVAALLGQDILGAIGASAALVPAMTQDLFVGSLPIERLMLGGIRI